jgi:hypothetical protein
MPENHNSSETMSKRSHRYWMCGGRSNRNFCGIFLIAIGLFWLGKEANLLPPELITLFWPLMLVLAGTWLIAASLTNKRESSLK